MSDKHEDGLKEAIYLALESSLEAQLRAIKRLRKPDDNASKPTKKSMSQIDLAYDILSQAAQPLHISDILEQIQVIHHVKVDRESLVSALTKKIKRGDRFIRTGKNIFSIKKEPC